MDFQSPSFGCLNGLFTYIPETGFVGTDSFTYKLWDGLVESSSGVVTITVTNSFPVASPDSFEGSELGGIAGDVLANDADPDGDPLQAELVADVSHGSLVLRDGGSFIYMPEPNFIGQDAFSYVATDGITSSGTVSVSLTVSSQDPIDIDGRDSITATAWMSENDEADYGLGVTIASSADVLVRVPNLPSTYMVLARRIEWDPLVLSMDGFAAPGYIDLSPTGGNETFSVQALGSGYVQTQIMYAVEGTDADGAVFSFVADLRVVETKVVLQAVQFQSDHNLIRANTKNVLRSGPRYNDVEFVRSTGYNAPITHTWNEKVTLRVELRSIGFKPGDRVFVSGNPGGAGELSFGSGWRMLPAETLNGVLTLTADNKIRADVYVIDSPIDWEVLRQNPGQDLEVFDPGDSGPHRIYVTMGTPKNHIGDSAMDVTDIRMQTAFVDVVFTAIREAREVTAPSAPTYQRVVYQTLQQHVMSLEQSVFPTGNKGWAKVWEVPRYWEKGGADCVSGAAFTAFVGNMVGVPGTLGYRALAAKSRTEPTVAVDYSNTGRTVKLVSPASGREYWWELSHEDRSECPNRFEAAVVYVDPSGAERFFPSGLEEAYDSADEVLYTFEHFGLGMANQGFVDWPKTDYKISDCRPWVWYTKRWWFTYDPKPTESSIDVGEVLPAAGA